MTKEVTINLLDVVYDVQRTPRLSVTLREFERLPLEQRWRGDMRLERIENRHHNGQEVFLLDFCKRREVGPGRLGHVAPITAIELQQGEDFGEETAALYSPSKKWLLVLHNYAGVGPSRMATYFNALDPGNQDRYFDYQSLPKLDATALARFRGLQSISKVSVTATLDALADAQANTGAALADATRSVNAKRLKVELMANEAYGRGGSLSMRSALAFIRGLQGQEQDDVSELKVQGRADGQDQLIDLLEHRIRRKYPVNELQVLHHRYTLESRWTLLLRTFHYWHETL